MIKVLKHILFGLVGFVFGLIACQLMYMLIMYIIINPILWDLPIIVMLIYILIKRYKRG